MKLSSYGNQYEEAMKEAREGNIKGYVVMNQNFKCKLRHPSVLSNAFYSSLSN